MNIINNGVPLVERFRPSKFEDIVLDPYNKIIMQNIINTSYFPNLLFFGPPGTGKTTSIINLVNEYQKKNNQQNKGLIIHLNASDERGIDIIRNQINQFVNSKTLFNKGMKFVILDEVDYMTKNAQQALRYLLQNYSSSVRFCLICNYISRIDEGLQNEFLRLRFNQLPEQDIIHFLTNIVISEKINISSDSIIQIQQLYKSDIRSMINFLQSNQTQSSQTQSSQIQTNQTQTNININIINNHIWDSLYSHFEERKKINDIIIYIHEISLNYNIDKKNIIKDYLNYIIRNKPHIITTEFLTFFENIMHYQDCKNSHYIKYALTNLLYYIPEKIIT